MTNLFAQLSMVNTANLGGIELTAVQFIVKLLGTSFITFANGQLETSTFFIAK